MNDWPRRKRELEQRARAMTDDELSDELARRGHAVAVCDVSVLRQRDRERNVFAREMRGRK